MSREMHGHGTVYQRGSVWWIQYSQRGKVYRESTHSGNESKARKLLKNRIGEASTGKVIGPLAEKVTLTDMKEALLANYRLVGNRSVAMAERSADSLIAYFGESARALDITTDRIEEYVNARLGQKSSRKRTYSNGTVNREVAALRRMFNLMVMAKRLSHDHIPSMPMLQEAPARAGHFEPADFARLSAALPEYLRNPVRFLYLTGWRKGAMRSLMWMRDTSDLQFGPDGKLTGGTIHLQPGNSKNKRAFHLLIDGDLVDVIGLAWEKRISECPFIFHFEGAPIGDFRKAWKAACKAAGLGGHLIHDLRRSCARNLIRAGVSERVAMSVTGHLTRSIFDRYNITADHDLKSAMTQVSAYVTERQSQPAKVIPLPVRAAS
jgi:integrase